ncbi:DNA-directed RNA polymerase omega subunit [Bacillus sp. NRRL B-14911]|nr:DNA-directed RNA polymerase omega subunit [Bacillus sp. NRRL B-14911]
MLQTNIYFIYFIPKCGRRLFSPDKHKTLQDRRRSLPSILKWLMTRGASAWSWTNRNAEAACSEPTSIKRRVQHAQAAKKITTPHARLLF